MSLKQQLVGCKGLYFLATVKNTEANTGCLSVKVRKSERFFLMHAILLKA